MIFCIDGLRGFPQAIEAVYPKTAIQQCIIIHQMRNTTKFVSYKEIKPLMTNLKRIYAAPTEEISLAELNSFDEKWSCHRKYWGQIHFQLEIFFEERLSGL